MNQRRTARYSYRTVVTNRRFAAFLFAVCAVGSFRAFMWKHSAVTSDDFKLGMLIGGAASAGSLGILLLCNTLHLQRHLDEDSEYWRRRESAIRPWITRSFAAVFAVSAAGCITAIVGASYVFAGSCAALGAVSGLISLGFVTGHIRPTRFDG